MSTFTREDSQRLTSVGPDSEMGALMRRYWIPVCLSEELPTVHCDPIPVTVLGEKLVAFRGADGAVGLLDRYCPHRRADLVLARNEDCALRCVYHGWKMDAKGAVLEAPPEPPSGKFAQSVENIAYPTRESGNMVWAYLGPADQQPPFPNYPFDELPQGHVQTFKIRQPRNWVRSLDGELDAGHAGYLHFTKEEWERQRNSHFDGYKYLFDPTPSTAVTEKPYGLEFMFRYGLEEPDRSAFWVRNFLPPIFAISGQPVGARGLFIAYVPAHDRETNVYFLWWREDAPISEEQMAEIDLSLQVRCADPDRDYVSSFFTEEEGYVQDREAMTANESYSGFEGVLVQDLAVQYSMDDEVNFERENLGAEDMVVIRARRYLLGLLDDFAQGKELPCLQPDMDYRDVEFRWVVAPSDTPFTDIAAHPEWAVSPGPMPEGWKPAQSPWIPIGQPDEC